MFPPLADVGELLQESKSSDGDNSNDSFC
jgi:hypothetical protein